MFKNIKKFANFGDNVISLKVLKANGGIVTVNKKNNLFYKIIGGQSLFGIILEAKLLLHEIKNDSYLEENFYIKNNHYYCSII